MAEGFFKVTKKQKVVTLYTPRLFIRRVCVVPLLHFDRMLERPYTDTTSLLVLPIGAWLGCFQFRLVHLSCVLHINRVSCLICRECFPLQNRAVGGARAVASEDCSAGGRVWMVSRLRLTRAMQPAVPCPCVQRTRGLGKSAGLLDRSRTRHAYLFVVLTPTAREWRYK